MRAVPLSRETRRTLIRAAVGLAAPVVVAGLLGLVAPASIYLWIKAGHLTAVIGWMGGMIGVLYLLVWQAQAELGSREAESLAEIEQQAMRVIVNPAMVMTWGLGLWLAWRGNWFSDGWLHAKLLFVMVLSGVHGWAVGRVRRLASAERRYRPRFYVRMAAATGLFAAATVVIAVVKPM